MVLNLMCGCGWEGWRGIMGCWAGKLIAVTAMAERMRLVSGFMPLVMGQAGDVGGLRGWYLELEEG